MEKPFVPILENITAKNLGVDEIACFEIY